ncbi:MAG: hypothetical protein A3H76_03435 [Candidatus Lloydbacteria bacterium RIFCSPLOWO2_02_FULL_54_12]|nr:MAG: hypothetical protein A3H76_03435 [Candidatus Lloydbacteria bacterium RIFCSPLOWO2_02_FULL_54_12]
MPRGSAARIALKTVSAAADSFPAKNARLSPLNVPSALQWGPNGLTFFTLPHAVKEWSGRKSRYPRGTAVLKK